MQKWTKEDIVKLLETNDKAVGKALSRIAEFQTADELASEDTVHRNGMGFRPCDARVGTSMAKFFNQRGFLSAKQLAYWRKPNDKGKMRIAVYAAQILRIMEIDSIKVVDKASEDAKVDS